MKKYITVLCITLIVVLEIIISKSTHSGWLFIAYGIWKLIKHDITGKF